MQGMYEEYKETLCHIRKLIRKIQDVNSSLREKNRDTGEEYIYNKNMIDITIMNEMVRDLVYDIECIEYYLPYEERRYLHRKVDSIKNAISSQYDLYGLIPDGEVVYSSEHKNVENLVCNVEMQEEIVELLDKVLTERQKQVVDMYYFEGKTQEQIARELGINQQNVQVYMQNAIEKLREYVKNSDLLDF